MSENFSLDSSGLCYEKEMIKLKQVSFGFSRNIFVIQIDGEDLIVYYAEWDLLLKLNIMSMKKEIFIKII